MRNPEPTFEGLVAESAKPIAAQVSNGSRLRIAVLGPGLHNPTSEGGVKRQQIYDALDNDGHTPFFPEQYVSLNPLSAPAIEQERLLLSAPDVDLVIILCTTWSPGAIGEIYNFVSVPAIKAKAAVLFPVQYYWPDDNLTANTAQAYRVRLPYSNEQFKACSLVSDCRKWALDCSTDKWQVGTPYQF